MARAFTTEQQEAIHENQRDICVAAGAGSGKTGVLVERYVRLLADSANGLLLPEYRAKVDEILVITFTDKATKEMKSRIVEELNQRGMISERRQVETAYISTIHGFCSRLLQENPFEAGIDPQFKVLDDTQAKRLLRAAFEEVAARAYAEHDAETIALLQLAQSRRQREEDLGDPFFNLANAVENVLQTLRGAGRSLTETERHWLLGEEETALRSLAPVKAFLNPILHEIQACWVGLTALKHALRGAMFPPFQSVERQIVGLNAENVTLEQTIVYLNQIQQAVQKLRDPRLTPEAPESRAYSLFSRIREQCATVQTLFKTEAEHQEKAQRICHRLWGMTVKVWREFNTLKKQRGVLDNDDLQAEGVRLLEESEAVRTRYREQFRHILLDEFQDTNPLQMRLIELLHTPEATLRAHYTVPNFTPAACETTQNRLFIVGDVQQSIYAFRNAEPRLFREIERQFREEKVGLHVTLAQNFRSRPEILELVRHIFKRIWQDSETPFVPLTRGAEFTTKERPSIELLVAPSMHHNDYHTLEANALASRIQQIVENEEIRITSRTSPRCGEPVAYKDIAVLFRALTDITHYERAFAQRGVPYFVVGAGRGYYARFEIRDVLNALTVLDAPLNDLALAATLRSPFVGVETDTLYRLGKEANSVKPQRPLYFAMRELLENHALPEGEAAKIQRFLTIIERLRDQEDRLPVGHLLERLITQTQYDARLLCRPGGRRRLANVRKMLQMANSDPVMGVREFIRRLRDLERLSEREGDAPTEEEAANVVRFFTMHGAKGLEFPVVVLADLSRPVTITERRMFLCDPHTLALGTKMGGKPDLAYEVLSKRNERRDIQESERLLYVAMTRAREHLLLSGAMGTSKRYNWASALFPLLNILEPPPEPTTIAINSNLQARIAPLSLYADAPQSLAEPIRPNTRAATERHADHISEALLNETNSLSKESLNLPPNI